MGNQLAKTVGAGAGTVLVAGLGGSPRPAKLRLWESHSSPAAAIWGGELMTPLSPPRGLLSVECWEHTLRVLPSPTPPPPGFLFLPLSPSERDGGLNS